MGTPTYKNKLHRNKTAKKNHSDFHNFILKYSIINIAATYPKSILSTFISNIEKKNSSLSFSSVTIHCVKPWLPFEIFVHLFL